MKNKSELTTGPLFDEKVLADLRELSEKSGGDFWSSIIGMFLEAVPDLLSNLREIAATDNGAAFVRVAHRLKGTAGNVGARTMVLICAALEEIGRASDFSVGHAECLELIEKLESEFAKVQHRLEGESNL